MKFKIVALSSATLLLATAFTTGYVAQADHNYKYEDDDEYEYHDDYKKSHDDDHYEHMYKDDNEYDDHDYGAYPTASVQDTWNNWSRTVLVEKGSLPVNEPTLVSLTVENEKNNLSFTIIPRDGELFVPGAAVAKTLGSTAKVYETSQILDITSTNAEMIFKANTNVVYENRVKIPLPSVAFSMNGDIYVPISALINGLGYSVQWQAENQTFVCQLLTIN